MLFEREVLNNIYIKDFMNTNVPKISMDKDINEIKSIILNSDDEIALIISEKEGKECFEGIITAKDILRAISENISVNEYIKKHKTNLIINYDEKLKDVIKKVANSRQEYIPVMKEDKAVGVLCLKELITLYDDLICKRCNMIEMVLDNINDAITVLDKNCITRFWNKGAEKLYEIPRERILGRPITDFFPNALLPKVIKERRPYENVYNSPRENFHNIISAKPLFNGTELIGGVSCDRDVSEYIRLSKLLNKTQLNLQVLEEEVTNLSESRFSFSQIVGNNPEFRETVNLCKKISKSNLSVLITGESGTGKEVFARAIHIESGRKGLFIPINCSAIPGDLMESELFGYEGGAFTGALKKGKIGKFELAHEGTLFLDEIGDMPLHMQSKILRVLEDGEITRIGGSQSVKVDVRIIAATNKNLKKLISRGLFRKDLYYRLNSILIKLPPLRERRDDIPELVNKFLEHFCITYRTNIPEVPDEIMEKLMNYNWEGNIRELRNIIERIVILVKNNNAPKIDMSFLPQSIIDNSSDSSKLEEIFDLNLIAEKAEKEAIIKAMKICNGNKARAAKLLNIPRSTLYFKLEKYKIVI